MKRAVIIAGDIAAALLLLSVVATGLATAAVVLDPPQVRTAYGMEEGR